MNDESYLTNIKNLRINYIFHLVLYVIIIIFNFILLIELLWLNSLTYYLYLSLCIFGILYFLIPIIPFIYVILKKLTKKSINIFKIVTIIFCALVFISGLGFIIILMINGLLSTDFCLECPFNLKDSYVNNLYEDFVNNNFINDKKFKEQCTNRRCIFNNKIMENQYPYEYMCNYDPSDEFDKIKNSTQSNVTINQIECRRIDNDYTNYNFEQKEIYKFLEMCNSFNEFYFCQRINEPKYYSIDENFKCPKENYMTIFVALTMFSIFLNLVIGFLLWRAEYIKYKELIIYLTDNNRAKSNSLNSTQNLSKVKKDEIDESFKKEQTQIIIVYNETEENDKGIISSFENGKTNDKNNIINNNLKINSISINSNIIKNNQNINNTNNNNNLNINENFESKKEEKNSKTIININKNLSKKKIKEEEKNNEIKIKNIISNSQIIYPSSERYIMEGDNKIPKI